MIKNMNINGLALQAVTLDELDKVEGGVVPVGAVVGAVAIIGAGAVACVAVGAAIGWGLYELFK